ncbi:orotate phosphoribosyltransferase [Litorivivens lipolytica]|uniref:Orotate phosphoribosyltransferase n=1 Tax=Litorivivens lipolytica TaxID=1524264 RepID=A0A7W4W6V6_9GAMM|nr:orotate phosphoribosyltransferase [Litorivivens lipolytica]MBB3048578.1 orotate phosphoribosyltransferase [Litorivivens lipolytica]
MELYQQQFIAQAIAAKALTFGEFTLKSGRTSPYFFNAGKFYQGAALATLSRCYAAAIAAKAPEFQVLYGPAYKGIVLAAATSCAMADQQGRDIPYAYNRKEAKNHGEGGVLVGAPLEGKVLIIDDVITAGTAIRESVDIIRAAGAEVAGVIVGLDREERGQGERSAIQEVEQTYGFPVLSIVKLADIVDYLRTNPLETANLSDIEQYRQQYGV